MRTRNLPALATISLIAIMLFSCSKGGSSGGGTTPPPAPGTGKSLKVTLEKSEISSDNWETASVFVTDQNNIDVTSTSTIYLGSVALPGNTIFTNTPGSYQIKATRSGVTSPEVSINVKDAGPSPFKQKIIVEDYTGTWCGHCPRVGIKLEEYVVNGHPNCLVIANHGPNNDPYTFSNHGALATVFNPQSLYPTVSVDRDFKWNESTSQLDVQLTNRRPPLGLALQTSVTGNTINVTTKVKFDVSTVVNFKLIVYLLQDGEVYPQVNYNYYGLPDPIPGYVHNGILRRTGTDLFGDDIPVASQVKGTIYEKTFGINATGFSINNCRVIAFVVQGPNSQGRKEKVVINAQTVKAGLNKDFD